MTAHRYWSVNVLTIGGGTSIKISQINFQTALTTDLNLPGPGSNGTWPTTNPPVESFATATGITGDFRSTVLPTWIGWNFGSAFTVAEVSLQASTVVPTDTPSAFTIDWSDDGSAWTNVSSQTAVSWSAGQVRLFPTGTNTPHQYWRVNGTASSGGQCWWHEIQLHATVGGSDIIFGTASATSVDGSVAGPFYAQNAPSFGSSQAISGWKAAAATTAARWVIDLGAANPITPVQLSMTMFAAYATHSTMPASFTVDYSDDGVSFTTVGSFSGVTWNSSGDQTQYFPFAPGIPSGLTITGTTTSSLALSWTAPTVGTTVTSYTLQYRLTGSGGGFTQVTGITATNGTLTGLSSGTLYDIQVEAVSGATESGFTATLLGVTFPAMTVTGGSTNSLTAQWPVQANPVLEVTYLFQYRQTGTTPWTQIGPTTSTQITASGLLAATQYDFQIEALGGTNSAFTATITAWTVSANPDALVNVVGDYRNGNLYFFNLDEPTDNGTQRKWLRSWRALQRPSFQPVRFPPLQIDMETGLGVADGANPQVVLRWSDDGGHTWSNEQFAAAGKTGETARRVMFRRTGSTRRNSGLDRIYELSSTDVFTVALIGAEFVE